MKIDQITSDQFAKYNVDKNNALLSAFATERKWFVNADKTLLGVVLEDKIDKDWGYVVLSLEDDGFYRVIDVNTSLDSSEVTENSLYKSIDSLYETGKKEEQLFNADEETIKQSIIIKDIDEEIKKYFNRYPEKLYDLSPRKFEELVASIFKDLGFDVELTKATRDGGRDIIARIRTKVSDYLTYVECKKYSTENKVGVGIIREVIGVHHIRKPAKSIIVTTSFFSKDAIREASAFENQLDLKDFNNLKEWLKNY
jgi:restriction endonuclease Mrr